jgi:hypothetical protein
MRNNGRKPTLNPNTVTTAPIATIARLIVGSTSHPGTPTPIALSICAMVIIVKGIVIARSLGRCTIPDVSSLNRLIYFIEKPQ